MTIGVASFDDAFDMPQPARKKAPRPRAGSGKSSGRKGRKPSRLRIALDGRRVVRWGAIGMSGTLVVAILVNALVLQKGHHPAPLFGKSIALGPGPVPAQRPQKPEPVERAAPVAAPEPVEAPPPASRHASAEPAASGGDPIGALIAGHAPPPSAKADGKSDGKTDGKTVLGAQKALAKLGFTLKPTGTMGPQTRKAIETFERDRHLPVKGELTRRLVKVLAAESGVRID